MLRPDASFGGGSAPRVPNVFVSHSSEDKFIAQTIGREIEAVGATYFLSSKHIEIGAAFDVAIKYGLESCSELLVLLTPSSVARPWVWVEVGAAWGQGRGIVGVVHGLSMEDDRIPIFLRISQLVDLEDLDQYLDELRRRVEKGTG